ncbi:MAG: YdcF family protein [Bacteroidetes bacterium]|nr:YdcF family protein [Bacteroidota bacterium]
MIRKFASDLYYVKMFFFISKILSFLITPVIWVFVLLLFSLLSKNPKRKKRSLIWALCLFYFFSNSFILEEVNRVWEVPATHYKDLKTYDAGIVLGGMLEYDIDFDRLQFFRGADRLFQAVELYKTGVIKKIFFVGGSGSIEFAHIKEGMFVRRYLLTIGIPDKDIWIENESRNTHENAINAKGFLEEHQYQSGKFLLITSASHMRRAFGCFNKVRINVSPYSVDRNASPVRRYSFDHLFIPDVETLLKWDALIHEWIGMIVYKMKGYA